MKKKIVSIFLSILLVFSLSVATACDSRPVTKPVNSVMNEAATAMMESEYVTVALTITTGEGSLKSVTNGSLYLKKTESGYDMILHTNATFTAPASRIYCIDGKVGTAYKLADKWYLSGYSQDLGGLIPETTPDTDTETANEDTFINRILDSAIEVFQESMPETADLANRTDNGYSFSKSIELKDVVNKLTTWLGQSSSKPVGEAVYDLLSAFELTSATKDEFINGMKGLFVDGLSVTQFMDNVVAYINSLLPEGKDPLNLKTIVDKIQEKYGKTTQEMIDELKEEIPSIAALLTDAQEGETIYDYLRARLALLPMDTAVAALATECEIEGVDSLADLGALLDEFVFNEQVTLLSLLNLESMAETIQTIGLFNFTALNAQIAVEVDKSNRFSSLNLSGAIAFTMGTEEYWQEMLDGGYITMPEFVAYTTATTFEGSIVLSFDYSTPDIEFVMPTIAPIPAI